MPFQARGRLRRAQKQITLDGRTKKLRGSVRWFELKYWPILALLAGVMSIVPIFGSIASSVPVVLIGLTQGFWVALWVLLWIIGVH